MRSFKLTDSFLASYKQQTPPWGFNGLGEFVYYRTYSRIKDNGENEVWWETCRRVIEGTYNIQKRWIINSGLEWNEWKAQKSAQEGYDLMFNMKWLPPGRGLWAMGSPMTENRNIYACLNNCGFVSTTFLSSELANPFVFLMDMSMLGVGVGFDTHGEGSLKIQSPKDEIPYTIPDSREGWTTALKLLLESYYVGDSKPVFDYKDIRPKGEPIKGFGGVSSGHEPLKQMLEALDDMYASKVGSLITDEMIVDTANLIGCCVVAGNVRRTAEIALGKNKPSFLNLKNYELNPHRSAFGWTSNNSLLAEIGMDYSDIADRIKDNGEPGIVWLDNIRGYSRMGSSKDNKDFRAMGTNPCGEQTLEHYELCCLVENFPNLCETKEEFERTLKFSYLYAKTVTLCPTHWPETNRVMLRNRRIGCSLSGIAQFIENRGMDKLKDWCEDGYNTVRRYDDIYSDWLAIPKSIKVTSIKPSGTISLLNGSTPGAHYAKYQFYIRRVRVSEDSNLIPALKKAGFPIEPDKYSSNTLVISFPVDSSASRDVKDVGMWEQLNLAAFLQKYWSDNQVSCTVEFTEKEAKDIKHALNYYQYQLKAISFLPRRENVFPQMPYEEITKEEYERMVAKLKPIEFNVSGEIADTEKFCSGETCTLL